MINACFGKTMENVKKNGVDVKFVNGRKRLLKLCSKSSFKRFKIFNENLVGIENRKVSLKLDKPIFC
jgi:translation initiation factor IF-1